MNKLNNKKITKNRNLARMIKYAVLCGMLMTMLIPVSAFATTQVNTGLGSLATFFSDAVRLLGIVLAIYGIATLGPGISQHDNTGIKMGLLQITGAAIMIFNPQILALMGITI